MRNRSLHRWLSIFAALPLAVIVFTGCLLELRSFLPWMEPVSPAPTHRELRVGFDQILAAAKRAPPAGIHGWDDVAQIDARPGTGQIRVRAKLNHWEVLVDGETGEVAAVAQRRVAWFTSLHQGALFGPVVRYGIFLPSAVATLVLLVTGLFLFFQPWMARRRARRRVNGATP